jgi:hypothetical protein
MAWACSFFAPFINHRFFFPEIIFSFFPRLFSKYVKAISYFFALFILLELTGVHLNQWVFPGEFIGWVELFGIKFPFEEFFFFIILGSAVILSYYEVFADDRK